MPCWKILACLMIACAYGVSSECITGESEKKTMEERMVRSNILVYGVHLSDPEIPAEANRTQTVVHAFKVFCIFKSDGKPIMENIIIQKAPSSACTVSKLPESSKNKTVIVGLKRTPNGNYTFHETTRRQTAVFNAIDDNFFIVKRICQLANWTSPTDATEDKCPGNVSPGFCANYTLPNSGLKTDSSDWILFGSLLIIISSLLTGQTMLI